MGRRSDHTRQELHKMVLTAAREVVEKEGFTGLTARRVARDIGYSIGTIYNLFDDFDDLILNLNGETLDRMYDRCAAAPTTSSPEDTLKTLARAYIEFVREYPGLWSLVFEYRNLHPGALPDWYREKLDRLFGLMNRALDPLFPEGCENAVRRSARVLRASLQGICSLEAMGAVAEPAAVLADDLVRYYVAGLRHEFADRSDTGSHA